MDVEWLSVTQRNARFFKRVARLFVFLLMIVALIGCRLALLNEIANSKIDPREWNVIEIVPLNDLSLSSRMTLVVEDPGEAAPLGKLSTRGMKQEAFRNAESPVIFH